MEKNTDSIKKLIDFCHQEKIFYFYSHIIRFATYLAIMNNNDEKVAHFRDLLEQYTQLDTSEENLHYYHMYYIHYYSIYKNQPLEVLKHCKVFLENPSDLTLFAYSEAGITYYQLGNYIEAKKCFESLKSTDTLKGIHPIDRSAMYRGFAYKALTQIIFDEVKQAKETIQFAYDSSHQIPEFPELKFIDETYVKIMNI